MGCIAQVYPTEVGVSCPTEPECPPFATAPDAVLEMMEINCYIIKG